MPASEEELTRLRADAQNSLFFPVTPTMIEVFEQDATVALVYAFFRFATFQGERAVGLTTEQIAAKTRLSLKQVKRARGVLVSGGYVKSERRDKWDSTCTFSLPDRSDPVGDTQAVPVGDTQAVPVGTSPLLIEELEEEKQDSPAGGELVLLPSLIIKPTSPTTGGFEEFWSLAVHKKAPARARVAYAKAVGKVRADAVLTAWARHNRIWAQWPKDQRRFIEHPSTWLNAESWDGDDPDPRGSTSNAFGELAERWGGGVSEPTYTAEQITGTLGSDTSGWG